MQVLIKFAHRLRRTERLRCYCCCPVKNTDFLVFDLNDSMDKFKDVGENKSISSCVITTKHWFALCQRKNLLCKSTPPAINLKQTHAGQKEEYIMLNLENAQKCNFRYITQSVSVQKIN